MAAQPRAQVRKWIDLHTNPFETTVFRQRGSEHGSRCSRRGTPAITANMRCWRQSPHLFPICI